MAIDNDRRGAHIAELERQLAAARQQLSAVPLGPPMGPQVMPLMAAPPPAAAFLSGAANIDVWNGFYLLSRPRISSSTIIYNFAAAHELLDTKMHTVSSVKFVK